MVMRRKRPVSLCVMYRTEDFALFPRRSLCTAVFLCGPRHSLQRDPERSRSQPAHGERMVGAAAFIVKTEGLARVYKEKTRGFDVKLWVHPVSVLSLS